MEAREKLFDADEKADLDAALKAASANAFKDADVQRPIAFTRGILAALGDTIVATTKAAIVKATKRADSQQEIIAGLVGRLDRTQQQVSALNSRVAALERKAKGER